MNRVYPDKRQVRSHPRWKRSLLINDNHMYVRDTGDPEMTRLLINAIAHDQINAIEQRHILFFVFRSAEGEDNVKECTDE